MGCWQCARHHAKCFTWDVFSSTDSAQRWTHKSFLINTDCAITWIINMCFVSCPELVCLSQVLIQSLTDRFSLLSQASCTKYHILGSSLPNKNENNEKTASQSLSSVSWNGFKWNRDGVCPSPLPGYYWMKPLLCQRNAQWCLLCVRSRQPSSVWENTQISHPLANGRLLLRATARSKALSLTQLWFVAAITSSLTSHWTPFQVRPAGIPSFLE